MLSFFDALGLLFEKLHNRCLQATTARRSRQGEQSRFQFLRGVTMIPFPADIAYRLLGDGQHSAQAAKAKRYSQSHPSFCCSLLRSIVRARMSCGSSR